MKHDNFGNPREQSPELSLPVRRTTSSDVCPASTLLESDLHYRSLFTEMTEGFALHEIICDERGEPVDYRFLDINPAFEKETGLKRKDVVGRLKSAVLPGDDSHWLHIYGKVALTGEPVRFENYSSALGRHYEVFSYSPGPLKFVTLFTDITRRKQAENLNNALDNINRIIHSTLNFDEIMNGVVSESAIALGFETAAVSLLTDGQWVVGYTYGFKKDIIGMRMTPDEEPHAMLAVKERKAVAIPDAYHDERVDCRHMKKWGIRSVMVVPLVVQGHPLGVIFFNQHTRIFDFSELHLAFANKLAATVSLALQNARLFEKAQSEIAVRKRIEQELRNSEDSQRGMNNLLTVILNSTHAMIACMDAEYNFITVNRMYAQADNRDPWFFEGKNHFDLYPDSENESIFRRVVETGEPYYAFAKPFEYVESPACGVGYWNWSLIPVKDNAGTVKMLIMSLLDVTAQVRAEQALRESQVKLKKANDELEERISERTKDLRQTAVMLEEQKEILQGIIDTIPVMLAFSDTEGKVRLVNKEFERVLGWSADDAQSMDFLVAHSLQIDQRGEWESADEGKPVWRDFDIAARSGTIVHSSWTTVSLSDRSLIRIGIDISTRRKMEQDMLRLAAAIEQVGEGIVLFSAEGVVEYANPAYEILSGHKIRELIGRNALSFSHEMNVDYIAIFDRIKTDGKTWTGHQTIKRDAEDVLETNMSVSPVLSRTGEIMNYVAVVQDITHEILLQQQLSQTQKMEAIGTLAGGIAHDLKNIFTPILINSEIAMEDLEEDSPVRPLVKEVLIATKLGVDLVKQIVTFSRRSPMVKKPVVVSSVIKESLIFIRAALPATIEIRYHPRNTRTKTMADPTQIKQVMINIGSNAAYAMRDKGGVLEIGLDAVNLDVGTVAQVSPDLAPGPYVRISVRDTGTGMDEKTAARIFDPFFTTKKGEGTGMGLAVVHGIVKDHRGAVTVRSRPGKGTTFTVYLPKMQDEPV